MQWLNPYLACGVGRFPSRQERANGDFQRVGREMALAIRWMLTMAETGKDKRSER
jgi:hypothetical protein